jgi:hypothetical protein
MNSAFIYKLIGFIAKFNEFILHPSHSTQLPRSSRMWGMPFSSPVDKTAVMDDDGDAGAGDLFVGGGVVETPGGVDLAVDAADGAFVAEAEAGGDLLVGHALRHHFGDGLFVGFQQVHRSVFIFVAYFLHARFDVRVDEGTAVYRVLQQRPDHLRQQVVGFAHVGVVAENAGTTKVAVVGVVVLDGVEDDGHPGKLAANGNGRFYSIHHARQLHVHQNSRYRFLVRQAVFQRRLSRGAVVDHLYLIQRL